VSVELATAFVHLQSSTRGLGKQITKEFGPLQPAASEAGDEASEGFAERFKGGLKKSMAVVGAVGGAIAAKGFLDATSKEAGSDLLAARIGLSPEESARIGKIAGGLYGNAYGADLGQVNDAIDGIKVNIGDLGKFSNAELTGMGAKALDLSKIMDEDVGRVTRGVGQLMRNGLAKDGTEAFDLITAASQKLPKEMRGELLDTIEEYSADLSSLGLTGPQAMGALSASVKAGARNTDLAADALRELSIRGIDGTKATAAGFTALGLDADVMAQKLAAGGPSAQKATSEIIQALSGMSDPIAQEAAGVALFGTRYEELGPKAIAALDPATAGLTDYEGAAKKAGDTLNDNTASSVEGFKRKASEMASNLAAKAIPHLEKLGRGFAGLPGPAQAAIAGLGGLAVAAGPISNTVDGVKNLATHAKSLGSSMASAGTKMGSAASKATTLATNLGRTAASGAKSAIVGIGNAAKTAGAAALSGAKSLGAWALAAGKSAASAIASTASIVAQKVAMLAGKVATGVATAAQWLWNAALTANPIGLVIAAVVGIVAALVLAYNKVGWFKAFVDGAFRFIGAIIKWVAGVVSAVFSTIWNVAQRVIGWIVGYWKFYLAAVTTVWNFVWGVVQKVIEWIRGVVSSVVNTVKRKWDEVSTKVRQVWQAIKNIVGGVVDNVRSRVASVVNNIRQKWDEVSTKVRQVWQAIKNIISDRIDSVKRMVESAKNKVSAMFDPLKNAAKKVFNTVAKFWNNTIGKLSFTAPSWVPGIGGKGFSMPQLPTYHTGGEVLGPRGQEVPIMALGGERVLSLQETAAYESGMSGQPINLTVNALSDASPDEIASVVISRLGWAMNGRAA